MSQAPSMHAVCDRLATLKGVPIYNIPLANPDGKLVGNNGDMLIHLGAQQLFDRCGLTFVDDPDRAELLLMGGNGGMLEKFTVVPGLFREYWSRYPDKPLLMLPSTYYFPQHPPTEGLPARSADVELFCRERVSYDHLRHDCHLPTCCRVTLSHDTAFALADSPLVRQYVNRPGKHILLVERDDGEHPSRFAARSPERKSVRQWIPPRLKKPLYPLRAFLFSKRITEFRRQCEEIIRQNHRRHDGLPRLVRDISRRDYCTFDEFCTAIGDAEIVFTSRLHVGIFAALLGKPTYIFSGPYHKIRAIYEHSMTGYANATLIPWGDAK
jgi:exopolysaccharide biosynthesis predicted pyruvyltransferase EpsI